MKSLDEFRTYTPVFPEAENCKTEELVGQQIEILSFAKKQGDKGKYNVILAKLESGRLVSFASGGVAINKWIDAIRNVYGMPDEEDLIQVLPESVSAILIRKTSKETGNKYFDFVNP